MDQETQQGQGQMTAPDDLRERLEADAAAILAYADLDDTGADERAALLREAAALIERQAREIAELKQKMRAMHEDENDRAPGGGPL